jgi:hypothetical protein
MHLTISEPDQRKSQDLDFGLALDKATESARQRLNDAYQKSVVVNPMPVSDATSMHNLDGLDMEWEIARLQELIQQEK